MAKGAKGFMSEPAISTTLPHWEESDLAIVCGIANAGGGTIVVTGVDRSKRRETRRFRKPFEMIPALCMRELGLSCTTEPVMEGMELCLEITVPAAEEPVCYHGNYYLYSNGANLPISGEELEHLYNMNATAAWESRLQPFVREEDLHPDMVSALSEEVEAELGDDPSQKDINGLLHNYGIKNKQSNAFTNVGILLLHRSPEKYIPGATVHIGLFHSSGAKAGMSEHVTGPLTEQLRNAMLALYERYIPTAIELEKEASADDLNDAHESMDMPFPPREAIEEALLNALVHKDYESEMPVRVSVYPNQLYIDNVGRPPATWTLTDFLGRHNSRPHNPNLAHSLQKRRVFNGWGSGVSSMLAACTEAGIPAPEFSLRADEMDVCFYFGAPNGEASDREPGKTESGSPQVIGAQVGDHLSQASQGEITRERASASSTTSSASIPTSPSATKDRKPTFKERSIAAANRLDLTSTDEYILKVIETNGRVTALRISGVLGVSESTVRRSFRRLREYGFIERIGSDKAGYWRLVD